LPAPIRERLSFGKIPEVLPLPDLIAIQRDSFDWLLKEGLKETFDEISPIEDYQGVMKLYLREHWFEAPKYTVEECHDKDITYSAPLFVNAEFVNTSTGEIKAQTVFMGDFPLMTDKGTFIINGTERVVVSQLVRSPGVYFSRDLDKTSDKELFSCKVIPGRGAWLEFEVDKRDIVGVRIDRKRRQNATVLLRALGYSNDDMLSLFDGVLRSLEPVLAKVKLHHSLVVLDGRDLFEGLFETFLQQPVERIALDRDQVG